MGKTWDRTFAARLFESSNIQTVEQLNLGVVGEQYCEGKIVERGLVFFRSQVC